MRRVVTLLIVSVALQGIAEAQAPCEGTVAFEEVLSRQDSFGEPLDQVIRNQRQWCEFWNQAHASLTEPPPCDASLIDFRREVVVASAIGSRPNGCYSIEVTCIDVERGRAGLRVFTRETVPQRSCDCTQTLTSPVEAVVVSKPVGRVRFIHEIALLQCEF